MVKIIHKKATSIDENINDPIDVVYERSCLIHWQKARLKRMIEREAQKPKPDKSDPEVDKAIKTHDGLLQHYEKMCFDLGLIKRVPQVLTPLDAFPTPAQAAFKNRLMHGLQINEIVKRQTAPWKKEEKLFKAITSAPDFPTTGTQEELDAAFEEKYEAELLNDMMQHEAEEKGLLH